MKQKEILEGNKIIAEFMGYKGQEKVITTNIGQYRGFVYNDIPYEARKIGTAITGYIQTERLLKFHSPWNWLMPVVEKIENLGFWFNIKKNHVTVAWDNKNTFDSNMIYSEFGDISKIERVYSCVVAFIKYHNEK